MPCTTKKEMFVEQFRNAEKATCVARLFYLFGKGFATIVFFRAFSFSPFFLVHKKSFFTAHYVAEHAHLRMDKKHCNFFFREDEAIDRNFGKLPNVIVFVTVMGAFDKDLLIFCFAGQSFKKERRNPRETEKIGQFNLRFFSRSPN